MSAQGGKASPPSRAKWRFYRALAVLLIIGLVALVLPAFLNWYDGQHQIKVECSVGAARPLSGGSVTRTGLGSSSAEVEITTKNCGKLLLREGVTDQNAGSTARQLDAGGTYRFEVGQGSYSVRELLRLIGRDVTTTGFRKIS